MTIHNNNSSSRKSSLSSSGNSNNNNYNNKKNYKSLVSPNEDSQSILISSTTKATSTSLTTTTATTMTATKTTTTTITATTVNDIHTTIANNNTNGFLDNEVISPVIMAKFLQHELKMGEVKHCETCQCSKQDLTVLADVSRSYAVATQTPLLHSIGTSNLNEPIGQLCLRCNSNLNSPSRTNSPYMLKLVKSSDSVISETKSSVSDLNEADKLFTPVKKDDLMVNPILSHHRLCERSVAGVAAANNIALDNEPLDASSKLIPTVSVFMASGGNWKSSCQRGFFDGGGTALDLLNKYEQQNGNNPSNAINHVKLHTLESEHANTNINMGQEDVEDETKPLLSMQLQANLVESERHKLSEMIGLGRSVATTASVAAIEYVKSPTKSSSLINSTLTGSVNSLWSRTSSTDGAKMFENFNRNLIKTIKAENPKNRGPRLCAMRIQQNGQSNILLDNVESIETVTPIIYKRRERLLDEELDDTKDIITSSSTSIKPPLSHNEAALIDVEALVIDNDVQECTLKMNVDTVLSNEIVSIALNNDTNVFDDKTTVLINAETNAEGEDGTASIILDGAPSCLGKFEEIECTATTINTISPTKTTVFATTSIIPAAISNSSTTPLDPTKISINTVGEVEVETNTQLNNELISTTVTSLPTITTKATTTTTSTTTVTPIPATLQLNREQLKQHTALNNAAANYELLRNSCSSRFSINSPSCTQSSSISSNVIDYQESVTLRRQQLNRVAEWVQNNTQQLHQQQQQQEDQEKQEQQHSVVNANQIIGRSVIDRQSSFSTLEDRYDTVSMEKLSLDSGYKTTPQIQQQTSIKNVELNKSDVSLSPKNDNANNNNNNYNNTEITYYRRTTRSGLPVAVNYVNNTTILASRTTELNLKQQYNITNCNNNNNNETNNNHNHNNNKNNNKSNSSSNSIFMLTEQPTCDILDYKYYPNDNDKTRSIRAELQTSTQSVDIAQMEYNVKQFLLKQNEWSMRSTNNNANKTSAATSTVPTTSNKTAQTFTQKTVNKHLKFLSNTCTVGPGLGERVNNTMTVHKLNINPTTFKPTQTTITTTTTPANPTQATVIDDKKKILLRKPQRTETNL